MADNIGKVRALTCIAPIIPERLTALRKALAFTQANPSEGLQKVSTVHYARWVIIDQGARLLFTSNFDGDFEPYIRDFAREIPDRLDRIWGNCKDYPGSLPVENFINYIKERSYINDCFFSAYPHLAVKDVLESEQWRTEGRKLIGPIQDFLIHANEYKPEPTQTQNLVKALKQFLIAIGPTA